MKCCVSFAFVRLLMRMVVLRDWSSGYTTPRTGRSNNNMSVSADTIAITIEADQIQADVTPSQTEEKSEMKTVLNCAGGGDHLRHRRWIELRKKDLGRDIPDQIRSSKIFCGNHSVGAFDSPIVLGGLIGVHRKKGESRESAMRRQGTTDEEDSSIFHPQNQTLRFNKRYFKTRDLLFYQNDGEKLTFQFFEADTSDASVRGQDWDDEYVFAKAQFQWSTHFLEKVGGVGHRINNIFYPVEMEFIHYRRSDKSLANAWTKNGVLIISVMMRLVSKGIPALTPLLRNIPYVAQPGPLKLLHAPVNFRQLFPLDDSYFEYEGSYTFSPCYNHVRRIVFQTPVEIDGDQLSNFQYLMYDDKKLMTNNFQPLQPQNRRPITYYKRGYEISSREKLENVEKVSHQHGQLKRNKFIPIGT